MASSMYLGVSHGPVPRRWPPASLNIFGTPYLHSNALIYGDEIWYGNMWESSMFVYRGLPMPCPKGVGPQRHPKFLGYLTSMHNNQILHGDQTRREEIFYKFNHEC